ncbi:DUF3500 domain-containing protein [Aurantibacter crassamenti]|uniref:DUF3500 domain-containing protein n=1 Tax=Aurantibacter crassamenti TaxID=1837375 RepID=UPI00193AC55B|nr:DUF3500 domain-containing protein [Aurantibacter crassamenti]MBM1106450.1 DUF3500 domain-containing protein [Aurantibacter crassamenti]
MKTRLPIAFIAIFLITINLSAQNLSEKATTFLESLSDDLRSKASFSLDDEERYNMKYVPISRKGPRFHDFNETQKAAAIDLLKSSLSEEGYRKSKDIMSLEKVLRIIEDDDNDIMPDGRPRRDPLNYHFLIFGDPASGTPWGWKFEGHHLSLNFTSTDGKITSATPIFFGTNPGLIKITGHKEKEVLKKETALSFKLVNSLSSAQLKKAKFADIAPEEIITTTIRKVENFEQKGIFYNDFTADQKDTFNELLDLYMNNYEKNFSEEYRAKIKKAGIENLSFSWAGSLEPGTPNYWCIQGPVLIIEYDNTQTDSNHVHTVVRDPTNDYGEDTLKKHYEKGHHKK